MTVRVGHSLAPFSLAVAQAGTVVVPAAVALNFTAGATITDLGNGMVGIAISGGAVGPGTPAQLAMFTVGGNNVEDTIGYQIADAFGDRIGVAGRFNVGITVPVGYQSNLVNIFNDTVGAGGYTGSRLLSVAVTVNQANGWGGVIEGVKMETLAVNANNTTRLWGYVTAMTACGVGKPLSINSLRLEDGWGAVGGAGGEPVGVSEFACIRANPFSGVNPADVAYFAVCDLSGFNATQLWGCYIDGATSYFLALAVGNFVAGTTLGNVVGGTEVFDGSGVSLGHVPLYDAIT